MKRRTIRVVRRTPPGQPDKSVGLLPVAIGVVSLITVASGAMLTVVGDRIKNAQAETEKVLRVECQTKIDSLRSYTDAKVAQMWQTLGDKYPSKAEWEARRGEIDRRLDEAHANFDKLSTAIGAQTILLETIKVRQDATMKR